MTEQDPFAVLHQQSVAPEQPKEAKKRGRRKKTETNGSGPVHQPPNAFVFFSSLLDQLAALPEQTRKDVVAALVKHVK